MTSLRWEAPAGEQSLTLHGALRVCRCWQERLGHQDLGAAVPPSAGCIPDFIPKAADCSSGPPAPAWLASQTTQCEDTACLLSLLHLLLMNLLLWQNRGLWFSSVTWSPSLPYRPPLLRGLCPSTAQVPTEASSHCLGQSSRGSCCLADLTEWLLLFLVCSRVQLPWRGKENLLSVLVGSGLGLGPAHVAFHPLLHKALWACAYSTSQIFVTRGVACLV